jgi:hypothetical protein
MSGPTKQNASQIQVHTVTNGLPHNFMKQVLRDTGDTVASDGSHWYWLSGGEGENPGPKLATAKSDRILALVTHLSRESEGKSKGP